MTLLDRVAAFWERNLPKPKPRRRIVGPLSVSSLDGITCMRCDHHVNDHDIIVPFLFGRCPVPT